MIADEDSYIHAKDLSYIDQIIIEVLKKTKNYTQFEWDELFAHDSFDNQSALRTDLNFRNLKLETFKDEQVQRWRKTWSDWSIWSLLRDT